MSEKMMVRRVVFPGPKQVHLEEAELPSVSDDAVRVRSICSLMSTGTENTVLNGAFVPGTHWYNYAKYPFRPGYLTVGRVEEVGKQVTRLRVGDLVAARRSHASQHVVVANEVQRVPDGIAPEDAAWFGLAKIAYIGARAAEYRLGENAVIVGCGPIGQLSVRWAAASGVRRICAVDTAESRLKMAAAGGATATICKTAMEARDAIMEHCDGEMPGTIMDTTGNAQVFVDMLRMSANRGRVVLLGDAGDPSKQHLTSDLLLKGLTIVAGHEAHLEEYDSAPVYELFFRLLLTGRMNVSNMITHVFSPEDCVKAYETANTCRQQTMGILFDWEGKFRKGTK